VPADIVMRTGDLVQITIPAPAIVPQIAAPVPLTGSSTDVTVVGTLCCLQGDELPPVIRGPLVYTAPPYVTPGTGTLTLTLMPDNLTMKTTNGGKPLLLKGSTFQAMFTVNSPAMQPTPGGPVPDPLVQKPGTARFISTNQIVKAG
jgi:Contractile injection system spike tip protein